MFFIVFAGLVYLRKILTSTFLNKSPCVNFIALKFPHNKRSTDIKDFTNGFPMARNEQTNIW